MTGRHAVVVITGQVIPSVGRFAGDACAAGGARNHDTARTKSCADSGLARPDL